ncbi:MAG TPA: class I SAM-dependent methyltransferase [Solirubrobacteraceae bacterium]|jgi:SAM-dependent methyltransferase
MVVTGASDSPAADLRTGPSPAQRAVVWHDLECGGYRVDLPAWLELAERAGGPVLDVGAGTGRVSLALARAGHPVTAVDRDQALLDALAQRAAGIDIETVCADARTLDLPTRDYALCVMPMQTVQLLGGAKGRVAFLSGARAHVRPGGLVACAILGDIEPFDCSDGSVGPTPERVSIDGFEYVTSAIRVGQSRRTVSIERERSIIEQPGPVRRAVDVDVERDLIELDRVSVAMLRRDARAAGLRPEPIITVEATDEHIGSSVVVMRV